VTLSGNGRGRIAALLAQRCPRCREGRIFETLFRIHERCPACGLVFEREPGYFVAAMYVSYAMAVPLLAFLWLLAHLVFPLWSFERSLGAAALLAVPFAPLLFRASRIVWIHLDRSIDRSP